MGADGKAEKKKRERSRLLLVCIASLVVPAIIYCIMMAAGFSSLLTKSFTMVRAMLFSSREVVQPTEPPGPTKTVRPTDAERLSLRVWTCKDHPDIRSNRFSRCPVCSKDLQEQETKSGRDFLGH